MLLPLLPLVPRVGELIRQAAPQQLLTGMDAAILEAVTLSWVVLLGTCFLAAILKRSYGGGLVSSCGGSAWVWHEYMPLQGAWSAAVAVLTGGSRQQPPSYNCSQLTLAVGSRSLFGREVTIWLAERPGRRETATEGASPSPPVTDAEVEAWCSHMARKGVRRVVCLLGEKHLQLCQLHNVARDRFLDKLPFPCTTQHSCSRDESQWRCTRQVLEAHAGFAVRGLPRAWSDRG